MQTSADFAKLIQPLLGRSFWQLYCDLGSRAPEDTKKSVLALQQCDPTFSYGKLMIEFDGSNDNADLTFTDDFFREGLGGPPIWALRVERKSIPALWAEELDTNRSLRDQTSAHCQLYPLEWRSRCGVSHNDSFMLTAAWAVPDSVRGQYEPYPCMSAVALQFDWSRKTFPSIPDSELPDWLKPGLLARVLDLVDRAIGSKAKEEPAPTGTLFLGMTYPVNHEEAGISYFFQDHLPDGLAWERVVCATESEVTPPTV